MSTPEADLIEPVDSPAGPGAAAGLPPLLQMLLSRPAGQPLDTASMLMALATSQGDMAMGGDNLAGLMQLLQRAPTADSPDPEPQDPGAPEAQAAAAQPGPDPADVRALVEHARAMEQELEMLRHRNDSLAAALGACYLCFGQDMGCPACRGRGYPGRRAPHPAHFRYWVQPVLERWTTTEDEPPPWPQAAPARHGAPASHRTAHGTGPPS